MVLLGLTARNKEEQGNRGDGEGEVAAHNMMERIGGTGCVKRRNETLQEFPGTVQPWKAGRLAKATPRGEEGDSSEEILQRVPQPARVRERR